MSPSQHHTCTNVHHLCLSNQHSKKRVITTVRFISRTKHVFIFQRSVTRYKGYNAQASLTKTPSHVTTYISRSEQSHQLSVHTYLSCMWHMQNRNGQAGRVYVFNQSPPSIPLLSSHPPPHLSGPCGWPRHPLRRGSTTSQLGSLHASYRRETALPSSMLWRHVQPREERAVGALEKCGGRKRMFAGPPPRVRLFAQRGQLADGPRTIRSCDGRQNCPRCTFGHRVRHDEGRRL